MVRPTRLWTVAQRLTATTRHLSRYRFFVTRSRPYPYGKLRCASKNDSIFVLFCVLPFEAIKPLLKKAKIGVSARIKTIKGAERKAFETLFKEVTICNKAVEVDTRIGRPHSQRQLGRYCNAVLAVITMDWLDQVVQSQILAPSNQPLVSRPSSPKPILVGDIQDQCCTHLSTISDETHASVYRAIKDDEYMVFGVPDEIMVF